jgi:hypothetical protein
MTCCDYGCTRAHNCPAGSNNELGQAKGRHIEGQPWVCAIMPIEAPPNVWREFLRETLFPCAVCLVLGAALMYLVLHFHPAP